MEFRDFVWIQQNFPKLKKNMWKCKININTYYLEYIRFWVFITNYLGILISHTVASYAPKTDEPLTTKVLSSQQQSMLQ